MILLAEHGVLSLMPHRVGATALEIALSKFADGDDIISPLPSEDEALRKALGFQPAQHYRYAEGERPKSKNIAKGGGKNARLMMRKFHNHMTAQEARRELGRDIFAECHKIAMVRNPFDRLVSEYQRATAKQKKAPAFHIWCQQNPAMINDNHPFYQVNGKNVIDTYIRFEDPAADIEGLVDQVPALAGLAETLSDIRCSDTPLAPRPETSKYFDGHPDLVAAVGYFNADIVKKFDYLP